MSGATSVLWHNRASFRTWGVPSPDGKWLAMLGATQESNVWVLDGLQIRIGGATREPVREHVVSGCWRFVVLNP